MKKILPSVSRLFLLSFLLASYCAQAQQLNNAELINIVRSKAQQLHLSAVEAQNATISYSYYDQLSHTTIAYLQQTIKGVPVYNAVQTAAFKADRLVAASEARFVAVDDGVVAAKSATPVIAASAAVNAAAKYFNITSSTNLQLLETGAAGNLQIFAGENISTDNIRADLLWLPIDKDVKLCWQISIAPHNSSDYWLLHVDAVSGNVLNKTNLTVSCKWEADHNESSTGLNEVNNQFKRLPPPVVNNASYRVIPFPVESPLYGPFAVVNNPWLSAGAGNNAISLGWHNDSTTEYNITRGNNVWAKEDRANDNEGGGTPTTGVGISDTSTTAAPNYSFIRGYNSANSTTESTNQKVAITNLFYWNNVIHDITYQYGFDEQSGNFQKVNFGRGGLGNDFVQADAQDGGGTNNANFATPSDGSNPRMQMYLFNNNLDGDLDAGVITHEYCHGISNRLTGGPANSACLQNKEQMGEGWSDWLALMFGTNWSVAQVTDGPKKRPIGNYVLGQSTSGAGIRTYPYSTDMSINQWTYAMLATNTSSGEPHLVGEIWAATLWDMTWNLIQQDGISANLYDPSSSGGNIVAMKLVMLGMKLQPCSPGFLDGRNAILKADTILFEGVHGCAIWKAFARRGMGVFASQGSSTSTSDQTVNYETPAGSVAIQSNSGSTSICNAPIPLSVVTPLSNATYSWYRDAVLVGSGTSFNASIPGNYSVVMTRFGCTIESGILKITRKITISPTATPATMCKGGGTVLHALGINYVPSATVGIGNASNTSTTYPCPIQDWYEGSRAQFLYRASELTAAGLSAGNITSLGFNLLNLSSFSGSVEGFKVSIGTTADTSLSSSTWIAGTTPVFGPSNYTPALGQNSFNFTSPFSWNGTDNIVVEVCNGDPANNTGTFYTHNPIFALTSGLTFNGSHTTRADNVGSMCGTSTTTQDGSMTSRPDITFVSSVFPTYTYQWSQDPASSTMSSQTDEQVNASNIMDNITYTVTATDNAGCTATANVPVSLLPSPSLATKRIPLTGNTANLFNGITSDTSGLTVGFFTDRAMTTPVSNIVHSVGYYFVSVVNASGCSKADSIQVFDSIPPSITCPKNRAITLTKGCSVSVAVLKPTIDSTDVVTLTYKLQGATVGTSPSQGINYVGQRSFNAGVTTITYKAWDAAGNLAVCSFTITVKDNNIPTIICPGNIYSCVTSVTVPNPTYFDSCGVAAVSWTLSGATIGNSPDTGINLLGTRVFKPGTTVATYKVKDVSGNFATCSFNVFIGDTIKPVITSCPPSVVDTVKGAACSKLKTIGKPKYTDDCTSKISQVRLTWKMTGATVDASPATGINSVGSHIFNVGITTITYTVKDAAGNSATCSFTVKMVKAGAPHIVCAPDTTVNISSCSTPITLARPDTSGNCGVQLITWKLAGATVLNSPATGINFIGTQTFNKGTTAAIYTLKDVAGNTVTCKQRVVVNSTAGCASIVASRGVPSEEVADDFKVRLLPNPTHSSFVLQVTSAASDAVMVAIYTSEGKKIQEVKGKANQQFRFGDNFQAGTYMIEVTQGDRRQATVGVKQ